MGGLHQDVFSLSASNFICSQDSDYVLIQQVQPQLLFCLVTKQALLKLFWVFTTNVAASAGATSLDMWQAAKRKS